ncbi:MAG TPA: apolipoprotein N-acyltransferase [Spirochaetia bacterium]|nr:apolipoprotein N-acyltransferase [Spirochaetia bacterium]
MRRADIATEHSTVRLLLLTLLSSVLLPLALPNEFMGGAAGLLGLKPDEGLYWGNAALGLVCIVPAFVAIVRAPSFKVASWLGVVFGGVSTALSSFWLIFFQGFTVWTYGGTILGYCGYNALLFPFLRGLSRIGGPRFRPFLLAIGWSVYEYFKSIGFLGYPWGLVGYPVGSILPLVQFVDITGVWGLCLLMATVNAVIAELVVGGWRPLLAAQSAFVVVLLAGAFAYGFARMAAPIPASETANVLMVQQNVDPWGGGNGKAAEDSAGVNIRMTAEAVHSLARKPDVAVWSESSVSDVGVNLDGTYYPPNNTLVPGIQSGGVPVLFGGVGIVDMAKRQYWNAAVLADASGKVLDIYGKMHPVPFAESIPFYELKPVADFFRDVVGIWNPWVTGTRHTVFRVPLADGGQLSFGVPICFEDAFADLCRQYLLEGADMLVNITNDSWSKTWSSEIQHFQVARFRAIENRRVLIRSTNGGLSAVVDPWGRVTVRMPFFERTWRDVDVPVYREASLTPYSRFGDWLPQCLILFLLIVLVVNVLPTKKRSSFDDLFLLP